MTHFKIGDRVVALSDRPCNLSQPRKKGEVYKVLAISYCSKCGVQNINIAGIDYTSNGLMDCECGNECVSNGLWWTDSKHFAPAHFLSDAVEYKLTVTIPELLTIKKEQLT